MSKITYYLGAGASYNALPVVDQFKVRVKELIDFINDSFIHEIDLIGEKQVIDGLKINIKDAFVDFIKDLNWLLEVSNKHASVDTYAKILYLKRDFKKLDKFKNILSAYLVIEETKKPADYRYDNFLASIINGGIDNFPKDIKILSWNYDTQFEKAYTLFTENNKYSFSNLQLGISKKHELIDLKEYHFIHKLNGSTAIIEDDKFKYYISDANATFLFQSFLEILKNYILVGYADNCESGMSFAWEEDKSNRSQTVIERACLATADTEILVVIGYSFPFFNREIDRKLITNMNSLTKVYFQAPDAKVISERFSAINSHTKRETSTDVWQFFFPPEL